MLIEQIPCKQRFPIITAIYTLSISGITIRHPYRLLNKTFNYNLLISDTFCEQRYVASFSDHFNYLKMLIKQITCKQRLSLITSINSIRISCITIRHPYRLLSKTFNYNHTRRDRNTTYIITIGPDLSNIITIDT